MAYFIVTRMIAFFGLASLSTVVLALPYMF